MPTSRVTGGKGVDGPSTRKSETGTSARLPIITFLAGRNEERSMRTMQEAMRANGLNPAACLSTADDEADWARGGYRDFSKAVDPLAGTIVTSQTHQSERANQNESSPKKSESRFPARLHYMLNDINNDESMRGFVILDRKRLEMEVLPLWFTQTKIESFFKQETLVSRLSTAMQLNLYGFKRINYGRDKGCYYHELLLRGKPFLADYIRSKPSGRSSMRRRREAPETEPDFYSMPSVEEGIADSTLVRRGRDDPSCRAGSHAEQRSVPSGGAIPSDPRLVGPGVLYGGGMPQDSTGGRTPGQAAGPASSVAPQATVWLRTTDGGLAQVSLAAAAQAARLAHPAGPHHPVYSSAVPASLLGGGYLHAAQYATLPLLVPGAGPTSLPLPVNQDWPRPLAGSVAPPVPFLPMSFLHQAALPAGGHGYGVAPGSLELARPTVVLGKREAEPSPVSSRPAGLAGEYQQTPNLLFDRGAASSQRSRIFVPQQQHPPPPPTARGELDR